MKTIEEEVQDAEIVVVVKGGMARILKDRDGVVRDITVGQLIVRLLEQPDGVVGGNYGG